MIQLATMLYIKLPFLLVFTFLTGCAQPLEEVITGSWHATTPPQSLYFDNSGKVLLQDHKLKRKYSGKYHLTGSQLEMKFDAFKRPVIRQADVSGDTLTLSYERGPDEVYTR
jgi:hypothetical protein